MLAELFGTFIWEYLMKSFTDFCEVVHQHGIFLFSSRQKVHIDFVFRQTAGHQFPIRGDDVSSCRMDDDVFLYKTVGYILPILPFGEHDNGSFHDDRNSQQCHDEYDERISQHNVFLSRYHFSESSFFIK